MLKSFPSDILVFDSESVLHARFGKGKTRPQVLSAKSYRLPAGTFSPGAVSPTVENEAAITDAGRRIKMDAGRIDRVGVLLPDPWFRLNLLELPNLPGGRSEADELVRWNLRRTMPIPPHELRVAYAQVSRNGSAPRVLVASALEKTMGDIERALGASGIEVSMIEATGLNVWNAILAREQSIAGDRLFVYVREHDFTTAVFHNGEPVFLRSRNLSGERRVEQEMKLSASYLRTSRDFMKVEASYLCGNQLSEALLAALSEEFNAPVKALRVDDYLDISGADATNIQAELIACTGVLTT